jgi:hypothetical protein
VLHELPGVEPAFGRKRKYGKLLATPEQLLKDDQTPFQSVRAFAAGRAHDFQIKRLEWHRRKNRSGPPPANSSTNYGANPQHLSDFTTSMSPKREPGKMRRASGLSRILEQQLNMKGQTPEATFQSPDFQEFNQQKCQDVPGGNAHTKKMDILLFHEKIQVRMRQGAQQRTPSGVRDE